MKTVLLEPEITLQTHIQVKEYKVPRQNTELERISHIEKKKNNSLPIILSIKRVLFDVSHQTFFFSARPFLQQQKSFFLALGFNGCPIKGPNSSLSTGTAMPFRLLAPHLQQSS
ncbi:hypothetical protein CEXT_97741 [Caerostris extrusa]|uniref:Uncharacterized protein n=1 Tax=Caerostris extrusa TaxID=172846 RepID=A0AAV4XSQ7_CAEEX|nr:hypothetical protein CEXT_97741 [Caerostris extrusa]